MNGRNILIRGGAWMTNDMLLNLEDSRTGAGTVRARSKLQHAPLGRFSIRDRYVYNLCDRYGIMATSGFRA